ncbi:RNA polymerase sigma factor [Pelagerythrobacter marensis]|uniref:Sigma-70 factor FpvI (ECF subfamily), controling pyoverdin biosynthesis n=1 Tax=Pelagerythrobacter marensis TaxID=543877 RepID=A0A0G3X8P3_9SPHN|nr:RNA polymerase sigma factor [Pelagerythrobacter marensis]AKM07006.1 Sigma-70 factor FpvI (ECF subfamily), controling pyoverdin biosynthesis [Pelagerythrobacter marensis]
MNSGSGAKGELPQDDDELFRSYRLPLRAFFARRLRSLEEVDDHVQEVFCRLYALDNSKRPENPQAYVFQVAANLLRDRARRSATRDAFTRQHALENANKFEELSPERVLQGKQAVKALRAALGELPPRTRAIFLLHRFEGYKYREIARRLGISTSSVEKHMMSAIKHVFARMGKSDDQN